MAYKIIQTTDFLPPAGSYFYKIAQDDSITGKLQEMIDKWEVYFITKILGQDLADKLIATLINGVPTGIYLEVFNAIRINDPNDSFNLRYSAGLKKILMSLVYFQYVSDTGIQNALAGMQISQIDAATRVTFSNLFMQAENRYNESLEWIRCIQWYCLLFKPTQYPNFYGQRFDAESSSFL